MPSVARCLAGLLGAVALTVGCTHNVVPKVTPAKVPAVQPPIEARALLLLSPSFEQYETQESNGVHTWRYHYGEAMSAALADLVTHSFTAAQTRRVSDVEVLQWLAGTADTTVADVLLVPSFQAGRQQDRAFDLVADARLRLDARTTRSNRTFSWPASGHSARAFTSRKGLTGSTLEQVLRALGDSLAAHRAELIPAATLSGR